MNSTFRVFPQTKGQKHQILGGTNNNSIQVKVLSSRFNLKLEIDDLVSPTIVGKNS